MFDPFGARWFMLFEFLFLLLLVVIKGFFRRGSIRLGR
jgi:hypothetical protein